MDQQWDSTDAWVLKAIGCLDGGGSLASVIGAADYVNRAILSEAEFTGSVGRLLPAGLIGADLDADRYWLTESGIALCQRRNRGPEFLSGISSGLRKLGPPPQSEWALPEGRFAEAVAAYTARS